MLPNINPTSISVSTSPSSSLSSSSSSSSAAVSLPTTQAPGSTTSLTGRVSKTSTSTADKHANLWTQFAVLTREEISQKLFGIVFKREPGYKEIKSHLADLEKRLINNPSEQNYETLVLINLFLQKFSCGPTIVKQLTSLLNISPVQMSENYKKNPAMIPSQQFVCQTLAQQLADLPELARRKNEQEILAEFSTIREQLPHYHTLELYEMKIALLLMQLRAIVDLNGNSNDLKDILLDVIRKSKNLPMTRDEGKDKDWRVKRVNLKEPPKKKMKISTAPSGPISLPIALRPFFLPPPPNAIMLVPQTQAPIPSRAPARSATIASDLYTSDKYRKYHKAALQKSYPQPELWHQPPELSEMLGHLWGPEARKADLNMLAQLIEQSLNNGIPISYKSVIFLFFLQVELQKCGEDSLSQKINQLYPFLFDQLLAIDLGQVVRFAGLISEPREEANAFRKLIADNLLGNVTHPDRPWLSVKEKLEIVSQCCQRIITDPGVTTVLNDRAKSVKYAKQLQIRCEEWLLKLEKGEEVRLPALYHGCKKANAEIVPPTILSSELKETNEGIFGGAFTSLAIEDNYFAPGFAFTFDSLFVPSIDVLNVMTSAHKPERRWIGIRNGIPITLKDSENNIMGHNLATVIAVDGKVEEQRQALPPALARAPIMEFSEAKLLEEILKENPSFLPKYFPRVLQQHSSTLEVRRSESIPQKWDTEQVLNNYSVSLAGISATDPAVYSAQATRKISSKMPLRNFMKAFGKNPAKAREMTMKGYFSRNIALHTERREASEVLMQSKLASRKKRMEQIATHFPESPPIQSPALLHTWPELEGQDHLFGTVVGYNPYLILNFASVQALLLDNSIEAREEILQSNLDPQFSENLSMFDTPTIHKLLSFTSLKLISTARLSKQDPSGSCIMCTLERDGQKFGVILDPNSFDNMEGHGRDERHNPNDPWLAAHLYSCLSAEEKSLLHNMILNMHQDPSTGQRNERVELVKALVEEMAEGMQKRYFSSNEQGWSALPERLPNTPLKQVLEGATYQEILSDETNKNIALLKVGSSAFLPKIEGQLNVNPNTTLASKQKISRRQANLNSLMNIVMQNNKALWLAPAVLQEKAARITPEDFYGNKLMPTPESVILMTCKLLSGTIPETSTSSGNKVISKMIAELSPYENARLQTALSMINGQLGIDLRKAIYPYLYKDCNAQDCHYQSVQEILAEAKGLVLSACHDLTGVYASYFGIDHLTPGEQQQVLHEWLGFIAEREQSLELGNPVALAHWHAIITDDYTMHFSHHFPESQEHFVMSLPNTLNAFNGIVSDGDYFTTKYYFLPTIKDWQTAFTTCDDSERANQIKSLLQFSDVSGHSLSYEAARLEARFLQGRVPNMIPQNWKVTASHPRVDKSIPSSGELDLAIQEAMIAYTEPISGISNLNNNFSPEPPNFINELSDEDSLYYNDEQLNTFDPNGKWDSEKARLYLGF